MTRISALDPNIMKTEKEAWKQLGEDKKERERQYIREKIVPRKKYKKVLGVIGAVFGSAVLFGAAAGGTFYVMQKLMPGNEPAESQIETIVIARDDSSLSPESSPETSSYPAAKSSETASEEAPSSEETETPSETEPPSGTESERESKETESVPLTEGNTEGSGEKTAQDESTGSTSASENTEEAVSEAEEAGRTLKERFSRIQKAAVLVTIRESVATDWFSAEIPQIRELYGFVIAENSEHVLILTQALGGDAAGSSITVTVDGVSAEAEFQKEDLISGLSVLRAAKADLDGHYELLPLGNSLIVSPADAVWFSGFSENAGQGLNEGIITYVESYRPVIDGYVQKISTAMLHYPKEQGILLNDAGELIGLVCDDSCTEGSMISAWGISPLKYLLEDMCSMTSTAYLGIRCEDVASDEAEMLGIPSGLYIREVLQGSPAYNSGLLPGDRLVRVGAGSVNTNHMLLLWMDMLEPGSEITVGLERRGPEGYEPLEITLVPSERN